jgi:hypothetical protein
MYVRGSSWYQFCSSICQASSSRLEAQLSGEAVLLRRVAQEFLQASRERGKSGSQARKTSGWGCADARGRARGRRERAWGPAFGGQAGAEGSSGARTR